MPFYDVAPASQCNPEPSAQSGITCSYTPAGDGSFSQNVQRLAFYAEDSWRATHHLTVNYGLRYQTTWGLFEGSGRSQLENSAYITLQALQIPIVPSVPRDYRKQIAPRLGFAWSPHGSEKTVLRAGFGLFYEDLVRMDGRPHFKALITPMPPPARALLPEAPALTRSPAPAASRQRRQHRQSRRFQLQDSLRHSRHGRSGARLQRSLAGQRRLFARAGNHGCRAFPYTSGANLFTPLISTTDPSYAADQANVVPNVNVFQSDNRSSYNALMLHLQGNMRRFSLVANYQLSKAQTWGCLLGELFDYADGVCTLQSGPRPDNWMPSAPAITAIRRRRAPSLCACRYTAYSGWSRLEQRHPA